MESGTSANPPHRESWQLAPIALASLSIFESITKLETTGTEKTPHRNVTYRESRARNRNRKLASHSVATRDSLDAVAFVALRGATRIDFEGTI